MRSPRLSRRELLAGVAAGAFGGLAGCSRVDYDDVLRLEVSDVQRLGEAFVGRVRIANAPTGPEREEAYGTRYSGVSIVGYSHDLEVSFRHEVGDMAPDTTATGRFQTVLFPFLLTADAESVSTDGDYLVEHGAELYVYDGFVDGSTSEDSGRAGHVWRKVRRRRISDPLPPPTGMVDYHKCRQRDRWRETNGTEPNLSIVPERERWLAREIPPPTIQRKVYFRTFDEGRLWEPAEGARHVDFEALPGEFRQAIEQRRDPRYMNRSEFFDHLHRLPGPTYRNVSDFPECGGPRVRCIDYRGENCREGGGRFTGELHKFLEYTTTYRNSTYVVAAVYHERWAPPDASPLPPCTDERRERATIHAYEGPDGYGGLETAVEGREVHPELADYLRTFWAGDRPYVPARDTSVETFREILADLRGTESSSLPECEWRNVTCHVDPADHCGSGRIFAFYAVEFEGNRTWLRLAYEWEGIPGSAEA